MTLYIYVCMVFNTMVLGRFEEKNENILLEAYVKLSAVRLKMD